MPCNEARWEPHLLQVDEAKATLWYAGIDWRGNMPAHMVIAQKAIALKWKDDAQADLQ